MPTKDTIPDDVRSHCREHFSKPSHTRPEMGEGGKDEDAMKKRKGKTAETEEKMAGIRGGSCKLRSSHHELTFTSGLQSATQATGGFGWEKKTCPSALIRDCERRMYLYLGRAGLASVYT